MGEQHDGLLGVVDDAVGEGGLVVVDEGDDVVRDVLRRDDRDLVPGDALAEADAAEAPARARAAHRDAVDHAGHDDVVDVAGAPRDLGVRLLARDGLADGGHLEASKLCITRVRPAASPAMLPGDLHDAPHPLLRGPARRPRPVRETPAAPSRAWARWAPWPTTSRPVTRATPSAGGHVRIARNEAFAAEDEPWPTATSWRSSRPWRGADAMSEARLRVAAITVSDTRTADRRRGRRRALRAPRGGGVRR